MPSVMLCWPLLIILLTLSVPFLTQLGVKYFTPPIVATDHRGRPDAESVEQRPGVRHANRSETLHDRLYDVLQHRKDVSNTVYIAFASNNMQRLLAHFLCNLHQLGMLRHFVLFPLDQTTHHWVQSFGHEVASYFDPVEGGVNIPALELECYRRCRASVRCMALWRKRHKFCDVAMFNSLTYLHVVHMKTRYQLRVLERHVNVFMLDVDIGLFAHPSLWLSHQQQQEFVVQMTTPCNASRPKGLVDFNTGFFYARSTANVLRLFRRIVLEEDRLRERRLLDLSDTAVLADDQSVMVDIVQRFVSPTSVNSMLKNENGDQLALHWAYFIPPQRFPDGSCVTTGAETSFSETNAVMFHANFVLGSKNKEALLRSVGAWACDRPGCVYSAACR